MADSAAYDDIDGYIAHCDPQVRGRLTEMREIIKAAAPEASEKISWSMPTFYLHGNLVHFATAKNHVGLYPGASGVAQFLDELGDYHTSKGAIQFPYSRELPRELIERIVRFRVQENEEKHAAKSAAAKRPRAKRPAAKRSAAERTAERSAERSAGEHPAVD